MSNSSRVIIILGSCRCTCSWETSILFYSILARQWTIGRTVWVCGRLSFELGNSLWKLVCPRSPLSLELTWRGERRRWSGKKRMRRGEERRGEESCTISLSVVTQLFLHQRSHIIIIINRGKSADANTNTNTNTSTNTNTRSVDKLRRGVSYDECKQNAVRRKIAASIL
jgi:hypothetical protein